MLNIINIKQKKSDPKTDPWGTPQLITSLSEM